MIKVKYNKVWITPMLTDVGCKFFARYKGKLVSWESNDMTLYEDAMSNNKRRQKAALRVVYENLKHIYYGYAELSK